MATMAQRELAACPLTPQPGLAPEPSWSGGRLQKELVVTLGFSNILSACWAEQERITLKTFGELPAEMTIPNCEQVTVVQQMWHLEARSDNILTTSSNLPHFPRHLRWAWWHWSWRGQWCRPEHKFDLFDELFGQKIYDAAEYLPSDQQLGL